MEESILATISKLLGIQESESYFDTDIILHINSAFNRLWQLGIGPKNKPFQIVDESATWEDFYGDISYFNSVKEYIYLYVRAIFDTSTTSSYVLNSIQAKLTELEWLMYVQADNESDDIFHPNMIYKVGDKVMRKGVHYVRITPQQEPENWKFDHWKVYDHQDETVPTYDISKDYVVGDKCTRMVNSYDENGDLDSVIKYYVCIINSPAGAFDATKWVEYKP
jgi:hypothetical protein